MSVILDLKINGCHTFYNFRQSKIYILLKSGIALRCEDYLCNSFEKKLNFNAVSFLVLYVNPIFEVVCRIMVEKSALLSNNSIS